MRRRKPTLSEVYEEYLTHARSMGLRESSTIQNIRSVMKPLLRDHGHRKIADISKFHVSDYFLDAAKRQVASSSLATTHNILNRFFGYAVEAGYIDSLANPMRGRRRPKIIKRERLRIPVHRWPELFAIADDSDPRDRAVVAVGLYTLLRDQEFMSLRIRDVDLGAGYIRAHISKSSVEDMVPISADLDAEIRRWYQHYQRAVGPLKPEYLLLPPLVRDRSKKDAQGRYVRGEIVGYDPTGRVGRAGTIVTPLIEALGYPVKDASGRSLREGAHTLRRSGARALYDHWILQGRADAIRIVQNMLHHKRLEETQDYIGIELDRVTRDELVRGVSIFGLDRLPTIGSTRGGGDSQWQDAV